PVALWSGIVRTDSSGEARASFSLPEFTGELRLMAVAATGDRFGSASHPVKVRDAVVLMENLPRFLTPGDKVDALVTVYNNADTLTHATVYLDCSGAAGVTGDTSKNIALAPGAEEVVVFPLTAARKPGKVTCRIYSVTGTDTVATTVELPNRPGQPLMTKHASGVLQSNDTVSFTLPDSFLTGTDRTVLQTSSLSAVTLAGNINSLVKYPYGCTEQTASGVFPLLYFRDLARFVQPELMPSRGPDYFIQEGIDKLSRRMGSDGWFPYWPGTTQRHPWTSVYASHCLMEAAAAGYTVDPDHTKAITHTLKQIARGQDGITDQSVNIYAAFVLAGSGDLEQRIVNYLRSFNTDALPPYSRYQLAAVLHRAGYADDAAALLPVDIQPEVFDPETGGNFSSGVRTNAILLDILLQINPDNPGCAVLANSLMADARTGRWYTTQSTAFALMALGKYFHTQSVPDFAGTVTIVDDTSYSISTDDSRCARDNIGGRKVTLAIDGNGPCFYFWQTSGIPLTNAPEEFARGVRVSREYLDPDGAPLDLRRVRLGSQVVCRVTAEAIDNNLYNVVVNDLLPAGFEIENPRLKTTPRLSWIPNAAHDIAYQDIRDDRLLLFTNLSPGKPMEFYYSLRVVAAGEFTVPPVGAECMYNPLIAGSASSGVLRVVR
ncbi:MAG: hypothetical protein KKA42_14010, partial [candidate division Zixibacteria bacterium]|nr:hypothetical protein [candidate division Zixibacteria bacterium]